MWRDYMSREPDHDEIKRKIDELRTSARDLERMTDRTGAGGKRDDLLAANIHLNVAIAALEKAKDEAKALAG